MPRTMLNGFTLIELMITVAIVGILASIAYPSYIEHIQKARRAEAQAALLELTQFMERFYSLNNSYLCRFDSGLCAGNVGNAPNLPYTEAPREGDDKYYNLSFSAGPTATTYTLQAVPKNQMANDGCGTMTVSNTGATTGAKANCWRR